MYEQLDQIKSFDEIMEMSLAEGKQYIEAIKIKHKVKTLQKYWKVSSYNVYGKLFKKFDVEVDSSKGRKIKTVMEGNPVIVMNQIRDTMETNAVIISETIPEVKTIELVPIEKIVPIEKTVPIEQEPISIFTVSLNGQFTGKETSDRIVNILTIMNVDNNYKINLKIVDIDQGSKLKSSTEHQGVATGKEVQDQIQNLNLLLENKYKVEFSIQEE